MRPGGPAVCPGWVGHRRHRPRANQLRYRVSYAWFDPDQPEALCGQHPGWSSRRPAPVRFRRSDYGGRPEGSLVEEVRDDLEPVLGHRPSGPVRLLTQLRRLGWLFNPISVYFVWDDDGDGSMADRPVGAVLEVTNTPWKERTRYPVPLTSAAAGLEAKFDKALHVSPFLTMGYRYHLRVAPVAASDPGRAVDDALVVEVDVVDPDGEPVVETRLQVDRQPATRATLGRSFWSAPLATYQVSAGIHAQALRLVAKGVPFVPHPGRGERSHPRLRQGSLFRRPSRQRLSRPSRRAQLAARQARP